MIVTLQKPWENTGGKPDRVIEKERQLLKQGVQILHLDKDERTGCVDLKLLMEYLGKHSIDSVLLEGGGTVNASAFLSDIVSEVDVFIAPKLFGGGKSPIASMGIRETEEALLYEIRECRRVGEDVLIRYQKKGETDCSQES
jgi:diaminohydroxyphosphoribosylaminopyrimidine deaminase/5-amino-6-(5-phosphoribosylamino)uracil reductase